MYCIVLGFMVTFLIALVVSSIFKEEHCDNPDLFTPFVAKRLRKSGLLLKKKIVEMVCHNVIYLCFVFLYGFDILLLLFYRI